MHKFLLVSCLLLTVMAVVTYVWFAVSLWAVEDQPPGNRTLLALTGALVGTVFAVVGIFSGLRDRMGSKTTDLRERVR